MDLTLHAKLLVACPEIMGYQTLVFKDLEYKDSDLKYITCVVFPNWDHNTFKVGDVGYLVIKYISAGEDKWFNGKEFVPYKYSNIQFLKFIKETKTVGPDLILD